VHVDCRLLLEVFADAHIKRLLDSARRLFLPQPKRTQIPISRDLVARLSTCINSAAAPAVDDMNIAAACRVAFAGFLRVGEFTYDAHELANERTFITTRLTWGDISMGPNYAAICLNCSKTDVAHEGVQIIIARTYDAACPVRALERLFNIKKQPSTAPLFRLQRSEFTRDAFIGKLKSRLSRLGVYLEGYTSYSFCRGAAQHAHNCGALDS
jgi:hypothetical protein